MMKFKFEQVRKSFVLFVEYGDIQHLLDVWRILWYREQVESEVKE